MHYERINMGSSKCANIGYNMLSQNALGSVQLSSVQYVGDAASIVVSNIPCKV
jgi:hypothetical protein